MPFFLPHFFRRPRAVSCLSFLMLTLVPLQAVAKDPQVTAGYGLPGGSGISTYYVDNVNGNDANSGDSPSSAFATVSKVNSLALTGGQTVAFQSGQEWREMLVVSQSGSPGAPITYTSYGTGAQPILNASDPVSGWSQGGSASAQESCGSPTFCSGFETADFADWTSYSNNNDASVSTSSAQVNHGSSSMALYSSNGVDTRAWVSKSIASPVVGSTLSFRWYFLAPGGSMKANSSMKVLYLGNGQTQVGFATLTTDGSGNPSTLDFYDTQHSIRILDATPLNGYLAGQWNEFEIDIAVSATSGGGSFYLNGQLLSQINTTDTSMDTGINTVELGNVGFGGAVAPGGTVYFDDFKFTNQAYAGPFNTGTATNVWVHPQTSDPKLVNFGGQAGIPANSAGGLTGPNQFFWDGSSLFVYALADPSGNISIPQRNYALVSMGNSYVTVSGLELRGASISDLFCSRSCSNWNVQNNTVSDSYSTALFFQVYPGSSIDGINIMNNQVIGGGAGGIQISNGVGTANIVGNSVSDFAKIYNPAAGSQNTYADGIEMYSQSGQEGSAYIAYNYIHNGGLNSSQNYGGGIHADTVTGDDIEHNHVENVNSNGIQLEKGSNSVARYNLVVNSGTHQYGAGLMIRAGEGSSVFNQLAEMNTIVGGWWACNLGITPDGTPVTATNIVIQKNICVGALNSTQFYTDQGSTAPGNVFYNNAFGPPSSNFIILNGALINSYSAFDAAVGAGTDSIQGDPLFVDPGDGNYYLQSGSPAAGIGAFP